MAPSRRALLAAAGGCAAFGLPGCLADTGDSGAGGLTPKDGLTVDFGENHLHGLAYDHRESRLYLATHYGLYVRRDDGDLFLVGDSRADHMGFVMHPTETATLYRSGHPRNVAGNLGVERSEDGGLSWERLATIRDRPVDLHAMAISDADPDVLVGADDDGLYVTEDGGYTWMSPVAEALPADGPAWGVPALAAHPADRETLLAGTYDGLYVSTDLGATWDRQRPDPIGAVVTDPTEPARRLGFTVDGIVETTDSGRTWSVLHPAGELNSDEAVTAIAIDRETSTRLFVGTTETRVLASTDDGDSWTVLVDE